MTHDEILNEALKSLLSYIDPNEYPEAARRIELILENYGLAMQIELLRKINERRE